MATGSELLAGTAGWELKAVDGGMAVRMAAAAFEVSIAYIYKALIGRRATGDSGINPRRGHRPRKHSCDQELATAGAYPSASGHHAGTGSGLASDRAWR